MLGDGNWNTGTQGSYFKYQYGVLKLLEQVSGFAAGSATAANQVIEIGVLNNILSALQNGQEFEQAMVQDLGGVGCPTNCPTYMEIRVWDTVTHTFSAPTYYNASGAVVVPVGPLQYVNPQFVLETILAQVTAINTNTTGINLEATQLAIQALLTTIDADTSNLDVALSTRASEVTVASILTTINAINAKIANDYGVSAGAVRTASQIGNTTGAADFNTGAPGAQTLRTIEANVQRTPTMLRATAAAAASVPANSRAASFFNASSTAIATVMGVNLLQGEQVTFEPGMNDTLASIAYNADSTTVGGGDLLITYVL